MVALERPASISFRLTQVLGRSIVLGEYRPDGSLPAEADLCERFGISRTAVREAVKMLAAKGLISSKPRQGIRVLPEDQWNIFDPDLLEWSLEGRLSDAVLKEFFQLRIAVEPEAAALAAQSGAAHRIDAVGAALGRMANEAPESRESLDADIDFHIAILYATGNRFYIRLRDFVRTALAVSIRVTTSEAVDYRETLAEHAVIFEAIRSGERAAARDGMRRLIERAQERLDPSPAKS